MSTIQFDEWYTTSGQKRGMVLQTVQTVKTTTWSGGGSGGTWYATDLTCTIQPRSATNKVLIIASLMLGTQYWELQGRFNRAGVVVGTGKRNDSSLESGFICSHYMNNNSYQTWYQTTYSFLDSPKTTNPITYTLELNPYGGNTIYINRTHLDSDNGDYYGCPISTVTLMEVQA